MKSLQFLENDYKCPGSDEDVREGQRRLSYAGFEDSRIESMQIYYQFHLMEDDEIYKIIFDKNNILVTYSMYISGSDSQFLSLISSAGGNGVKGITYIDTSGQLVEFLNKELRDDKELGKIMAGINTNLILTYNYKDDSLNRIKIQFEGYWDDCVVLEPFDLSKIDE
jgi:hypothetical protein